MIESPSLQKLCAANVPFYWNNDLRQELNAMKTAHKEHVKLSPLDTSKDLVIWTDAVPGEGMCYVLAQWKDPQDESRGVNIIACDSTTFKNRQEMSFPI